MVFAIHHYEYDRSRVPNGVLLFYWPFFIIVHGIELHSLVILRDEHRRLPRLIVLAIIEAAGIAVFCLELLASKKQSLYFAIDGEEVENECPIETANVFSRLTFGWMTPIMKEGYSKFLTEEDLWSLREIDTTHITGNEFGKAWEIQLQSKNPNIWIALFRAFGGSYFRGALFKAVHDILAFAQPQLLRLLISFVASYNLGDHPQPLVRGVIIGVAMFATSIAQTMVLHQYFQYAFETGMRIKSSLTAAIYKKSMLLSNEGRASKSTGDIVNLQAVDTQRLQGKADIPKKIPFRIFSDTKPQISPNMDNSFGVPHSKLPFV